MIAFGLVPLGVNQREWNIFKSLHSPISEDQTFGHTRFVEEHSLGCDGGRYRIDSEWNVLPFAREKLEQVSHLHLGHLILKSLGHQALLRGDELIDILAEDNFLLRLRVDDL